MANLTGLAAAAVGTAADLAAARNGLQREVRCSAAQRAHSRLESQPNHHPNLLFTYATAVLAQPHAHLAHD